MKDDSFKDVTLAHAGEEKFRVDGQYFRTLGTEFGTQNPVYTIRTMPEHMLRLDGSPAFETWTGGFSQSPAGKCRTSTSFIVNGMSTT